MKGIRTHHLPSKEHPPPLRPHRRARVADAAEGDESLLAHLGGAHGDDGEDGAVRAEEGVEREAEVGFAERGGEVGYVEPVRWVVNWGWERKGGTYVWFGGLVDLVGGGPLWAGRERGAMLGGEGEGND